MCGICGFVGDETEQSLARMTATIAHRGPDDAGTFLSAPLANGARVGLGSRRLAILDLSPAGHMPMSTPDGNLFIVYNGETYNFPELRAELEGKGYRFRSNSDTEVILYLYQEYGPECVRRLNGMFAIAIWDAANQQLFLARDHFGIKPLYYFHDGRRFAFASEVKALLELPDFPRAMCSEALHQYLTFLWVPDPYTMFEGVYKLPAGHYAVLKKGELRITEYWDLEFPHASHEFVRDERELAEELRERFARTVRSQMLSDVPLGAFLSAGLDSSSIVACMARASSQPVRTYTIGFPDHYRHGETTLDDTSVAARTAKHFGCRHTEIIVAPQVTDLLPKLVWHMDEPVADPAIITAYLVSREARKDVTVLLSGVGGDELFAGYRKHQAHFIAQMYQRLPALIRRHLVEPMLQSLPSLRGTALKGYIRLAKKMARSGSFPPEERFLTDSVYLSERQRYSLYTPALRDQIDGQDVFARHRSYFARVRDRDFVNQMLYLDSKAFMASLNLTYNDKMSMASSVETRVPFLDWEFAQWTAANIPPMLKLKDGKTKYILREAMGPWLPPEILVQKKAGFGAPVDHWLAHDMREMIADLLGETNVRRRGLFEPAAVQRYISEQQSGREDWSYQIWQLLTLELWQRAFIDRAA
jgi:asparagine synthase (glutamine-hydrolysing)